MISLAVIILTFNESIHIRRAIASLNGIASEIFVVDSFSNDGTVEIAQECGATVVQRTFESQSRQFQWALDNLDVGSEWVMRLDADEVLEMDLTFEIQRTLPNLPPAVSGVRLKRKHIWMNRWIRFGGRYPIVLTRIWRRGCATVEDRWMDEHIVVSNGSLITLSHNFADHNLNDAGFFTRKHEKYATREAVDVLCRKYSLVSNKVEIGFQSSSIQATYKRYLKEFLYSRFPFYLSAPAYFLWRYVFLLGFIDGIAGFSYHFLQGFWYRFLVGMRVWELESEISVLATAAERLAALRKRTGLEIK